MVESPNPRLALESARSIVVKIGSRSIAGVPGSGGRFQVLADQVSELRRRGLRVVLVSSGAVRLGVQRLGLPERPQAVPQLQAAAAVGQSHMMLAYQEAFERHGVTVAQVLLTHAGLADRKRYLNARAAIDALFELEAVPIINENDTVSTEEIEFGDNDQLAAMVATLVGADLLVLMTDVDGVMDAQWQRVSVVDDPAAALGMVQLDREVSLGGMGSKIGAATAAVQRGVPVVIAPAADPQVLRRVVEGEDIGTLFLPAGAAMASRKHWIAYTLKPRGTLVVDGGAARALTQQKRSLLPAGVVSVEGNFHVGDAVRVRAQDGTEIARGLVRYDARDAERLAGARSSDIQQRVGHHGGDELVHRDDLVVLPSDEP